MRATSLVAPSRRYSVHVKDEHGNFYSHDVAAASASMAKLAVRSHPDFELYGERIVGVGEVDRG